MSMSRLLVLALLLQALLIHWPSMALESGQAPVVMLLKLIETDDTAWLKQMAQKGHPIAELSLARAFRLGKGVERDPAQQLAWTQKAADQGFIWAEYEMGRLHETGEGVAANLDQALIWYRKAGVKNHIPALRRLSDLKDGADGGEGWRAMLARNEELERKYQAILGDLKSGKLTLEATVPPLEELAQAGSAKALTDLGGRQVDGRGIEKNQA
ncbi:MAG: sel1 repeat family protein, partial [Rhodospirillales bacterium]